MGRINRIGLPRVATNEEPFGMTRWLARRRPIEVRVGTIGTKWVWPAFGSIGHCVRAVGIESSFDRAHESPSDAEQWLHGMEELSYATCEASFEAKSRDEGRSGVGCRRPVSITSRGRIRSDQWVGGGYADDAEQYPGAPNHTRRRGNLRCQPGDVLRF